MLELSKKEQEIAWVCSAAPRTSAPSDVCTGRPVPMRPTISVSARRVAAPGITPEVTIVSMTRKASRRSARLLTASRIAQKARSSVALGECCSPNERCRASVHARAVLVAACTPMHATIALASADAVRCGTGASPKPPLFRITLCSLFTAVRARGPIFAKQWSRAGTTRRVDGLVTRHWCSKSQRRW